MNRPKNRPPSNRGGKKSKKAVFNPGGQNNRPNYRGNHVKSDSPPTYILSKLEVAAFELYILILHIAKLSCNRSRFLQVIFFRPFRANKKKSPLILHQGLIITRERLQVVNAINSKWRAWPALLKEKNP